ncbi:MULTISPECIES: HNH endonuclease [Burkholderia cepacia complex]|uniref:HNH nuclease domain-containing protein n=1 Tax=Burkholderia aenigmatica TaxID=2015348 RepID=A0A228J429_9BURK|nr:MULTISPECIES: HNH endonuclease [Burkholderia cepacia complex]MBJ9963674.1 HNH endonuclease [Burkholderia seminalis]OXI49277.1 hypothetical protein CFB84_10530 [Burkholderia aenigmatica]
MKILTLSQIRIVENSVSYDAEAGTLTWKTRPVHYFASADECNRWNNKYEGKPIKGRQIDLPNVGKLYSSRVAYILHTGKDLGRQIVQYIDANTKNWRWANLLITTFKKIKDGKPNLGTVSLKEHETFLRECFTYNPDTGHLIWNERPAHHFKSRRGCSIFNARFKGKIAGSGAGLNGHLQLHFSSPDLHVYNTRVIWFLETGTDPVCRIRHLNGDPQDNRMENLYLNEE